MPKTKVTDAYAYDTIDNGTHAQQEKSREIKRIVKAMIPRLYTYESDQYGAILGSPWGERATGHANCPSPAVLRYHTGATDVPIHKYYRFLIKIALTTETQDFLYGLDSYFYGLDLKRTLIVKNIRGFTPQRASVPICRCSLAIAQLITHGYSVCLKRE